MADNDSREAAIDHPLHKAVAKELEQRLEGRGELIKDPACGGNHQLPLFVGEKRGRDTRMCNVDLLVVSNDQVKVLVEIEESGFLPTKICGKFLQAALATHFIHDSHQAKPLPYADRALFIEVLDGSDCLKDHSQKEAQGRLIQRGIQDLLGDPHGRGITDYRLFYVRGESDTAGLQAVGAAVAEFLG